MYGCNGRGHSHQAVVDLLLARGAPFDLAAAAYLDDPQRAAALLRACHGGGPARRRTRRDAEGLTPLHFAAERGATAVARLLLDAGADPNVVDAAGNTPLLCAGHAGPWKASPALDLVDLLVARGARIDVFLAAALGDVPRLRALLDADPALVRATDAAGRTALYHAAHDLKLGAVDLLLDRGAESTRAPPDGQTVVGTAITHSWDEGGPAVVARLRAAGATLDLIDACIVGDVDLVRAQIAGAPPRAASSAPRRRERAAPRRPLGPAGRGRSAARSGPRRQPAGGRRRDAGGRRRELGAHGDGGLADGTRRRSRAAPPDDLGPPPADPCPTRRAFRVRRARRGPGGLCFPRRTLVPPGGRSESAGAADRRAAAARRPPPDG